MGSRAWTVAPAAAAGKAVEPSVTVTPGVDEVAVAVRPVTAWTGSSFVTRDERVDGVPRPEHAVAATPVSFALTETYCTLAPARDGRSRSAATAARAARSARRGRDDGGAAIQHAFGGRGAR